MIGSTPTEVCLDEREQVTVEDALYVPHFLGGAKVLHHLIGLQDIAADLASPRRLSLLASNVIEMIDPLLAGKLRQLRLEHRHRPGLVLELGPLVLALHDDPGRDVGYPDRRVRRVDMLATGAL
jgi:hypothetical protein